MCGGLANLDAAWIKKDGGEKELRGGSCEMACKEVPRGDTVFGHFKDGMDCLHEP